MGIVEVQENFAGFIFCAFVLISILGGMLIMVFIFGTQKPLIGEIVEPGSLAFNTSQSVINNSLSAIETYSEQSVTQMSVLTIAISLVILLLIFAFFWRLYMGENRGSRESKKQLDDAFR